MDYAALLREVMSVHVASTFELAHDLFIFKREQFYTRFAWAGGTCPRFAWAGGTFFPAVLLCQFLVLARNRFWVLHTTMYLEYHTVVVLFLF